MIQMHEYTMEIHSVFFIWFSVPRHSTSTHKNKTLRPHYTTIVKQHVNNIRLLAIQLNYDMQRNFGN